MSNILQFPNKNTKDFTNNTDKTNIEKKHKKRVLVNNVFFLLSLSIFVYLLLLVS